MTTRASARRERRGAVICGAYGMGNAGDEAVLASIAASLRRIEADMPVTVLSRRPEAEGRRIGGEGVHPLRVLRWMRAMKRARLFISGGGSLLQNVTSRRSLAYYLFTIRLAKKCGCAVQLYGCGIGPLLDERARRDTALTLNTCADIITVRDEASAELLRELGVSAPRILLAADPALSLPPGQGEREKCVGFVLRDWPGLGERLPALAAAARRCYECYRLTPVFFCFAPADRGPARAACRLLAAEGIPCSTSVDARRAGRMSLVISMRLHGLIFALRDGAPAAGISYDPKVDAFCREAGLPCLPLELAGEEALTALIDEAALLDGESLSSALGRLKRRERVNEAAAAQLWHEYGGETVE